MYKIRVIAACIDCVGSPCLIPETVYIEGEADYNNGEHYDRMRESLGEEDYEEPYVLFDEIECPDYIFQHFFPSAIQYRSIFELLEAQNDI